MRVSSLVSIGPAVWPAIRNIDHDKQTNKQTNKHNGFYYIDEDQRLRLITKQSITVIVLLDKLEPKELAIVITQSELSMKSVSNWNFLDNYIFRYSHSHGNCSHSHRNLLFIPIPTGIPCRMGIPFPFTSLLNIEKIRKLTQVASYW